LIQQLLNCLGRRFLHTYNWMLGYPELVEAGATYEQVVDNRAWE